MKRLVNAVTIALALFIASQCATAQEEKNAAPQAQHWWGHRSFRMPSPNPNLKKLPLISVRGNVFVNAKGDTMLFRGVSVADPDKIDGQGHWTKGLFVKAHGIGARLIRLPVHPVAWRERTPQAYMTLLDSAVAWCADLGMYVIIDWHSIGNIQTDLYQDPNYNTSRSETFNFWRAIARHFQGNNTVPFFELFNEPTLEFNRLGRMSWDEWKQFNEDLIVMIKAYDSQKIPLVAGFDWAYDLTPLHFAPIDAEGIGYVTHPYPQKRSRPWEPKWEVDFGFAADRYPVIATELGFGSRRPGMPDYSDYGPSIINFLEGKGISWLAWVFDPEWGPPLIKSWDTYELTESGQFFRDAMEGKIQKKK